MYGRDESFLENIKGKTHYDPANILWLVYNHTDDCIQPMLDDGAFPTIEEWRAIERYIRKFYKRMGRANLTEHNLNQKLHYLQQSIPVKQTPRPKQTVSGFIYLLRSEQNHYKIGKAKDIQQRLSAFHTGLPFAVQLIHSFASSDYSQAERCLHQRFASQRLRGEWFDLSDADVEWFCQLSDGSSLNERN